MTANSSLQSLGLDLVARALEEHGLGSLSAGPVQTILGRVGLAGCSRPVPSSAVCLTLDGAELWLPAPSQTADPEAGQAPLYLHGDHRLVLPTVRLFLRGAEQELDEAKVEYLSLSDWLHDAVAVWRFQAGGKVGEPRTLLQQLELGTPAPAEILQAVGTVLYFALFGADGPSWAQGLRLPASPMWLRPVAETPFAARVARSLVITARLDTDLAKPAVPSTNLRAQGYRIRPAEPRDWGLDPVHTPEGADIRLTARLGVGVSVRNRALHVPRPDRPPLSASTARLPFAGYDDPRRLLMAANMQVHAVPVTGQEAPRVRMSADADDPPGVNLRVAYVAWQGWNHEDAWVLSESAAQRLGTVEENVQTIAIRAVELPPRLLVQPGQAVQRGELLVQRFTAPALLCAAVEELALLADLDESVQLLPEVDDFAGENGTIAKVEEWDLAGLRGIPEGCTVPAALDGTFRTVYRIHIHRRLPLAVGDKIANRHGHKGVVGAIVPDQAMPRWRGQPLEALIDPISVLNRSNWGQVYEALAGALVAQSEARDFSSLSGARVLQEVQGLDDGPDSLGRWRVEPPTEGSWLTNEVRAVAGVQFVMRMPHHACDRISGNPLPPAPLDRQVRRRSQRLGEMEHWALWAHGAGSSSPAGAVGESAELTPAVARLQRLLAVAGFALEVEADTLAIHKLALDTDPPSGILPLALVKPAAAGEGASRSTPSVRSLADLYDALDAVRPETPAILVFEPALLAPPRPDDDGEPAPERGTALRWLPILPTSDRPPRRLFDGSEEPHELTCALRRVVRLLRKRLLARSKTKDSPPSEAEAAEDAELFYAVRQLRNDAYAAAVGRSATGQFSSKLALLRRGVLGRRLSHSARATVSPGGTLFLGLDEVGLPPALAHTLFGPGLALDEKELAEEVADRWVWLKRDPVLHRWGLMPVRVRLVPGDTIRMPPSLLGPLGADFDGDTVAVFAALPGEPRDRRSCSPPALAWHPVLHEAMFKPGKQYQYGLFLLLQDAERTERLQAALRTAGAPPWPDHLDLKKAFAEWTRQAVAMQPYGRWWAILEDHALQALAADPTMGFGLGNVDHLARLTVVRCGAAKDLYGGPEPPPDARARADWEVNRQAMTEILEGKSLTIYQRRDSSAPRARDPIADVMVAAKASIGQFGGALRRIVYSAANLRPDDIQKAQCLTEQVTQKALSVKAGKPPLQYADFERQLRRLLQRQELGESERKELQALLAEVGKALEPVWQDLAALMPTQPVAWLEWLRKPHELADLVAQEGTLRLPLDDLRLRCWIDQQGSGAPLQSE